MRTSGLYRWASCLLALSTLTAASGQATKPAIAKDDFQQEPYVILHAASVYTLQADGTGMRDRSIAVRIQSDASLREFGVVAVPFASASEHVDFVYVRVRRPDGTVLETPITDALEQPEQVTREAPEYSDLKEKQLPVKSLHMGDTLEWEARIVRTKAEAPNEFWGEENFVSSGVVLSDVVELHLPATKHVIVWTKPGGDLPTDTTTGGERVVRWTHKDLTPTVGAAAAAAKEAKEKKLLTPEEELDATKGALPSIAWTTFADWAAVGAWYRGLEAGRDVPDAAIKAKVAELTAGLTSDDAKAHAVYDYVSTQIRYIGVSFGVGRFQPHTAAEVLSNQFGDCKDKHTLLAAMLSVLGVHADAVLIGAGIRFNAAVPSPVAFNHLITQINLGGVVWLDSTAEVAPWATLLPAIRDQQALVIPPVAPAMIERTPVAVPYTPYANLTATETMDTDLTSTAHITMTFHDDDEIGLRALLRQVPPARYPEFAQQFMKGLGFGGTTSDATVSAVNDINKPLVIEFQYKRIKDESWGLNRITEPFLPIELPSIDEKKPPLSSIQLGEPRVETSEVEITLPEGWKAEVPEAVHAHSDFATCDTTFHLVDGKVHAERRLAVLKDKVPATDWKKYKDWADEAEFNDYPYLQLLRPRGDKAEKSEKAADSTTTPASPEKLAPGETAATLIDKANEDLDKKDYDAAEAILNRVKAINPEQRGLTGDFGFIALHKGSQTEAMRLYKKELDLHPESTWFYGQLAGLQIATDDKAGAAATMRQWSVADPDNPRAATAAILMWIEIKQPAEALKDATAALARIHGPSDDASADQNLQLAIGRAQVEGGEKQKGDATLTTLMNTTTDPLMQNNAAYELADAGLELPLDEKVERAALASLTKESQSWTLDEAPATLLYKTSLIFSSWDSLGWMYFREGKLDIAESYVRAAWLNQQDDVGGEHLGDIELARGNATAAIASYELARATLSKVNAMGIRKTDDARDAELRARIAEAVHKGGKPYKGDSSKDLQAMRTLSLGPAGGRSGAAPYRFLLTRTAVTRAVPEGDKSLPKTDALLKAANVSSLFPADSEEAVVKSGTLNCVNGKCSIVFWKGFDQNN